MQTKFTICRDPGDTVNSSFNNINLFIDGLLYQKEFAI